MPPPADQLALALTPGKSACRQALPWSDGLVT